MLTEPDCERRPVGQEPWDRYVRSRHAVEQRFQSRQGTCPNDSEDTIVNQTLYSSSKETYRRLVAGALEVQHTSDSWTPMWPVRPRPNPSIHSPSVVLDLPNIRNDFRSNLMDWSSTDYLTVAFPRSVYLWHARTNNTLRFRANNPSCVKWNPQGTELFTASRTGNLKLTDVSAMVDVVGFRNNSRPCCHPNCYIACSAFHPAAPVMLLGCSRGAISAFYTGKCLEYIDMVKPFTECITSLAFSCDGRYFASTGMNSYLAVHSFPDHKPVFVTALGTPSRALAWHPWKRSLLVVGDCLGCMALYNVLDPQPFTEPEATYTSSYNCAIVCLVFNPLSAELVASYRLFNEGADFETVVYAKSQLNVLASFDRVVDRMEGHTGRVPFLSWSPDGTRLASSGSDETARIWNFLPQSAKRKTTKYSKLNCVNSSLAMAGRLGVALR